MPRLALLKPARVVVTNYGGEIVILHLPTIPSEAIREGIAPRTLCGQQGMAWSPEVWNRNARVCRFCRRNAAGIAALFLIGPERSEGPSLARRRQPANLAGPAAAGDTSCKTALFGESASGASRAAEPEHGVLGDGERG